MARIFVHDVWDGATETILQRNVPGYTYVTTRKELLKELHETALDLLVIATPTQTEALETLVTKVRDQSPELPILFVTRDLWYTCRTEELSLATLPNSSALVRKSMSQQKFISFVHRLIR